jgi:hypothetical protein
MGAMLPIHRSQARILFSFELIVNRFHLVGCELTIIIGAPGHVREAGPAKQQPSHFDAIRPSAISDRKNV